MRCYYCRWTASITITIILLLQSHLVRSFATTVKTSGSRLNLLTSVSSSSAAASLASIGFAPPTARRSSLSNTSQRQSHTYSSSSTGRCFPAMPPLLCQKPSLRRRRSARLLALCSSSSSSEGDTEPPAKKQRGRPRKQPKAQTAETENDFELIVEEEALPSPKKTKRTTRSSNNVKGSTTTETTIVEYADVATTVQQLNKRVSVKNSRKKNIDPIQKSKEISTAKKVSLTDTASCLPRHLEQAAKQEMMQEYGCDISRCSVIGIDEAGRGPLAGPVVIAGVVCPHDIPGVVDSKKITKEEDREALFEEIMSVYENNKKQNNNSATTMEWAVCVMDAAKIDEINILQATLEGMKAVAQAIVGETPTVKSMDDNDKEVMTTLRIIDEASIQEGGCYVVCSDNVMTKHNDAKKGKTKASKDGKKPNNNQQHHYHALVDGNRLPKRGMPCPAEPIVKGDSKEFSIAAASILAKVTRDRLMHDYDKLYPEYNLQQHKGYPTAKHMAYVTKFGASKIHRRTFAPLKHMILDENGKIVK